MSVSGISSSNAFSYQQLQSNFQNFKNEFQQLGQDLQSGKLSQDLQSGNLAGAQSVYASLQQDLAPLANSSSTSTGNSSSNTNSESGVKTTNSLLSISI